METSPRSTPSRHRLLVGTYTQGASGGIQVFAFDPEQERIGERLDEVACSNPSWLVLDTTGRNVYAVHEDETGSVSHFRLDPVSGRLRAAERQASQGDHPTHASLASDGAHLFVANYAAGARPGVLALLPLDEAGGLGEARQIHRHEGGSAVEAGRQEHGHVHCVLNDPSGRYLFVCDLGADKVFVYRYRAGEPLRPAHPPAFEAPPGSGPRHLVFSADGRRAYLTLELSGDVLVLDHADGVLGPLQRLRLAPEGFHGAVGAGALHLSADGRFLYVADRGEHNHLVVYGVDPEDGTLSLLQRRACEGQEPREFALTPSGRALLVANQGSDQIRVMARDPQSGLIGETLQTVNVGAPSDLKFVSLP